MEKIDVLGEQCPIPVIESKKALRTHDSIEILVDNEISTQNLKKLADKMKLDYDMTKEEDHVYSVKMSKTEESTEISEENLENEETVKASEYDVLITDEKIGEGNDLLGRNLLKSFIYSLTEQDIMPNRIIFYNSGVYLVAKNSEIIEDLKKLEEAGVEVMACGICLDFYRVKEDVAVGSVTNMYSIVETLRTSNRVVKP